MELPLALREAIEQQQKGVRPGLMIQDAQALSLRYRTRGGRGERLLTQDNEACAYAAARMPATFGAVLSSLEQALDITGYSPETLMDAGAGTGAASWAADSLLQLKSITCLERESVMLKIGKAMMQHGSDALRSATWQQQDLVLDELSNSAELVIAAYVLNEMTLQSRLKVAEKLWKTTGKLLLLVEPGTPAAFASLMEIREHLLQKGAHVAAPCPGQDACKKPGGDWCHFTCRIARSRLHRQLKGGEAPFEDEKFSYIALSREKSPGPDARVLRHPLVRGGHVVLEVCTARGIENMTLSKSDGERYRKARRAKAGDAF